MGVLLLHGAGQHEDEILRYLQRQRLRSGLTAGFVAANRIDSREALNVGLARVPFEVRLAEYSGALGSNQQSPAELPTPTASDEPRDWEPIAKVRCLCCPRRAKVRANLRDWAGNVSRDLPGTTTRIVARRMPDVHRYLNSDGARAAVINSVLAELSTETRVVVGHSLGSVVAVDALARASSDSSPDLFVTVGSPLRSEVIHQELDAAAINWIRSRPTAWINVHDRADVITGGGSLPGRWYPGVANISVYNRSHYHAGDYYLRHPVVGALIWDVSTGRLDGGRLRKGIPGEYGEHIKYR